MCLLLLYFKHVSVTTDFKHVSVTTDFKHVSVTTARLYYVVLLITFYIPLYMKIYAINNISKNNKMSKLLALTSFTVLKFWHFDRLTPSLKTKRENVKLKN